MNNSSNNKKSFNCLLATHNNILQCNIDKLIPNESGVKIRFKNCAILCLTIDLNTHKFTLELVYDGLLSEKENAKVSENKPYYVKQVFEPNTMGYTQGHKLFVPVTKIIDSNNKLFNLLPEDLTGLRNKLDIDVIKIYIVRHGQAEHNEKKFNLSGFGLKLDTSVTQLGREQASQAAKALADFLSPGEDINIVFASDLQRTRQTLLPFFQWPYVMPLKTIVIDPCANELATNGDGTGNCWEKTASQKLQARENYPACNPQSCPTIKALSGDDITIDWSLYSVFYNNIIRGYPKSTDRPNCADTNMIAMAVFYLLNLYKIEGRQSENGIQGEIVSNTDTNGHISIGGAKTKRQRYKTQRKQTTRKVRNKNRGKYRK
jgi:broad specificity phosphatase PhoE